MITVVRLPAPVGLSPIAVVLSAVGRTDLALADELHGASDVRPYALVRRRQTLDVVSCREDLSRALLAADPAARLVTRVRSIDLIAPGSGGATLRIAFETPTLWRVAGLDHLLPDPGRVFGSLRERWEAVGLPALPDWQPSRVPAWPEVLLFREMAAAVASQRGVCGVVRYELIGLDREQQAGLWALARFGEYRGVGRLTSYGLGRMRILPPGERWAWSPEPASVWEVRDGARRTG